MVDIDPILLTVKVSCTGQSSITSAGEGVWRIVEGSVRDLEGSVSIWAVVSVTCANIQTHPSVHIGYVYLT